MYPVPSSFTSLLIVNYLLGTIHLPLSLLKREIGRKFIRVPTSSLLLTTCIEASANQILGGIEVLVHQMGIGHSLGCLERGCCYILEFEGL